MDQGLGLACSWPHTSGPWRLLLCVIPVSWVLAHMCGWREGVSQPGEGSAR